MTEHLFVIGPQRAGTTWLYELFCEQRSGVYLDRIEKENYFFSKLKSGGPEQLRKRFLKKLTGTGSVSLYADVVSTYFGHPEVVERILLLFPDAKFIFIRRDEESRKKSFSEHRDFNKLASAIIGYHISWELYDQQAQFDLNVKMLQAMVPKDRLLQLEFDDLKSTGGVLWTEKLNQFTQFQWRHVDLGTINQSRGDSSLLKRCFYGGVRLVQATRIHVFIKRVSRYFRHQPKNT